MNIGTAIQSAGRVLIERPASVLPVYLLVLGVTATARVPVVVGIAVALAVLVADGRLEALFQAVEGVDFGALEDPGADGELDPELLPPELETAVLDILSPEILAIVGVATLLAIVVSTIANGIGNAAAINGIYGTLYDGDGVADAVVGVGRDWKAFVGLAVVQFAVVLAGVLPIAVGVGLFVVSPAAGVAATLVGLLLSAGIIIVGLLALAFAGQSIVVDGTTLGGAIRQSASVPVRQPVAFGAYVLVVLGVFGGLSVFGGLAGALGVSQLSGIIGPLVAIPFVDGFKTALYADRPFVSRRPSANESSADTDGDNQIAETEGNHTPANQPSYRRRITGAFRDGLGAVGGFTRSQPGAIAAAAALFVVAAAAGWQLTAEFTIDLPAGEGIGEVFGTVPIGAFVMIAANNWLVSATAIYGGVALGVPTAVDMLLNGFIVGALAGVIDPVAFAALVAPHGIIELPAIIIAGGLGLHVGMTVAGVLRGTRSSTELAEVLRLAYRVLLGLAVILIIAAFVEAFLTPPIAEFVLT